MSFSLDVKEDLIKSASTDVTAMKLELEAMLRFSSEIVIARPMQIAFTCSSMAVIRHLVTLLKKFYEIEYEIASRVIHRFDNHTVFTCMVINGADVIISDLNLIGTESKYRSSIFENEEYMVSYLRGAFLARGTVNDPMSKNSHLEISTPIENEILLVQKLMNAFELKLNARIAKRKNYFIAYLKSKESVGDFLYCLRASSSMSYYEDVVITKEIKTTVKRTVNLDIANQDKTNKASQEMLECIEYLSYHYPLENMDNKLLMVMKVRKDYPEHSLNQLLDVIHEEYEPELSKSGLNHRLRKLKELARQAKELEEE